MANSTKTSTPARFGRTSTNPSAGRLARQSAGTNARRFNRPGTATPKARTARSGGKASSSSRFSRGGRKASKQKGLAGTIAGMLPTGAAAKATPSSKKGRAGGLAALAAAAGVAFRNREKLTAMVGGGRGDKPREQPPAAPAPGTATSVPRPGDTAGTVPRPDGGGQL